jgi:hypothetical protein
MCSCMFINTIISNNSFKIIHSKEIWMISTGCYKTSCNWCIRDLIISLKHDWWCKEWLLTIIYNSIYFRFKLSKTFLSSLIKLIEIDITSTSNNDILSNNIIFIMKLFYLLRCDIIDIVSDTGSRLTKRVIPIAGIMDTLHGIDLWIHWWSIFMYFWFDWLDLIDLECRVNDGIS